MKLKIISEGLGRNTKIINADTGEVIENARAISWQCEQGGIAKALIEFMNIPIEAVIESDKKGGPDHV